MVKANQLDEGPIPAAEVQGVANQYGVNRGPVLGEADGLVPGQIALNTSRGLFHDNVQLRKAVNWAIDRTDFTRRRGPYTRTPWTHLLPPGFPGSITKRALQPYAPSANIEKARQLAAGHFKDGRIIVSLPLAGAPNNAQAEIVKPRSDPARLDPANITMKGSRAATIYDAWASAAATADIGVSVGWCSDYPGRGRPATSVPLIVDGDFLNREVRGQDRGRAPTHGRGADQGVRQARHRDHEERRPARRHERRTTARFFFSNRVDPNSLEYHASTRTGASRRSR